MMGQDKIEAYLLSDTKKAAYASLRLSSIKKSRAYQRKTVDLAKREEDQVEVEERISREFEASLQRSRELFQGGELSAEAFLGQYRETTDISQWPAIILEVEQGYPLKKAADELERKGFYLADNLFEPDSEKFNKFKLFNFLHIHIPPDHAFLSHIASQDFSTYVFDAERVVSLPAPVLPEDNELVDVAMAHNRDMIFPGDSSEIPWPDNLGQDIRIGIIDSGIDRRHPDFQGRIVASRDFTEEANGLDTSGYGTHVAGIAAGSGKASNDKFAGVSPFSSLIDARVFDAEGEGTTQRILAGMRWAFEQGANVMNLSFKSEGSFTDGKSLLCRACNVLTENGVVVCVSAGNEGPSEGTISEPGDARQAICVGAVNRFKRLADFSSRGPTDAPEYTGIKPDLVAPGVNVIGPRSSQCPFTPNPKHPQYTALSGTSMSAPMVTGACALLVSYARFLGSRIGPRYLKKILLESADSLGYDVYEEGRGLLNGSRAFRLTKKYVMSLNGKRDVTKKEYVSDARKIGKYEIIEKIGEGGFGEVFKCFDPDLQVYRAVKVPFDQSDEAGRQLNEARLQAKVSHPNIVPVHSVEKIDDRWVMCMDYAEGGSLRDRLKNGKLIPVDDAVNWASQIAAALREAHAKDVLHHDIKPENILFTKDGTCKVTDFGIARLIRTSRRQMSKVLGTAAYMAPEQLEGTADLRSDIWSLGVILYEMLTGCPCFEGKSEPEIVKKIVMERPRPIRELNPSIPEILGNIVMRMLEKDPEDRHQGMQDVLKDLDAFRMGMWVEKRRPLRWVIPLCVAFILTVGGVVYASYTGLFEFVEFPFTQDTSEAVPAAQIPEDVKSLSFDKQLDSSSGFIEKGQFPLAYHILGHISENAEDAKLQGRARYIRASLALQHMNLPDLALAEYKSLIQEYPDSRFVGNAHYFLGWIYYEKKNNLKKAITHLTTMIERYPESSEVQTAEFLVQDAAKRLAKEGPSVGLVVKSSIGRFLPNNFISLILSLFGFVPFLSGPIAWILTQYHKPKVDTAGGVSSKHLFKKVMQTPGLKTLIIIVIISQIISFAVTQHKSKQDFENMVKAVRQSGVVVQVSE
ncbi:MAG: S8 family serine peptidase [Desulfobacterales bacterium]|nr:S8 family serine peptidase [Desulfobacterales bacterium]